MSKLIDKNLNHNFYDLIPKKFNKKYHNPSYKKHLINIPFRMLIVGGSGSGKTNTLLELIHRMNNTFENIVICCKSKEEPLYKYLEEKIGDGITFFEGIENVPNVDDFADCGQTLIVFDDLVLDKNQSAIEQYFIRGRKIGEGISCCYLTQNYFKTPKNIRVNCNYIILKKLSSKKDLNMILSEFSLGIDKDTLLALYKYSTSNPLSFLLIDIDAPDTRKYRSGFLEILSFSDDVI